MALVESRFMLKLLLLEGKRKLCLNVLWKLVECWMLLACSDNPHMVKKLLEDLEIFCRRDLYKWQLVFDTIKKTKG